MAYTTIDDPEAYFQITTWTGNGSTRSITLGGDTDMQPDLVWIQNRGGTYAPPVFDSVRGATKFLEAHDATAEQTVANTLTSFDSDGFSLGADTSSYVNRSSSPNTYVAWCWKGGGSASANSVGSIDSSVSANTTSGFGIATYTGSGSADTVGHGIGIVPQVVIAKRRDSTSHYMVYHHSLGNANELYLNQTSAMSSAANTWNSTTPTATVSSVKNDANNTSSGTFVNYLFAPVQGFSKFGKYTGNGNADGAMIFTGMKPAFLLVKKTGATGSWWSFDNKRLGYNPATYRLYADDTAAENTTAVVDFVSNGFKFRTSDGDLNGSGVSYVYLSFAEAPFVNSEGVPCNAR